MKKTIFVVEGTHDEQHLKKLFPEIETISVGGSAIKEASMSFLIQYQDQLNIILLFDPDYPGEKIRKQVSLQLKNPQHVYIDQSYARYKRKIGIEHVTKTHLEEAFQHIVFNTYQNTLSKEAFIDLGLEGHQEAKKRRAIVSKTYHIGYANAKTLFKRLNLIGKTKEDLQRIIHGTSI
jgi:ribonuclease M5